ncbi:MAG: hypothetical protein LBJ22_01085, partial [Synergistaceae bacterium]|nr:hypothetical protein [Synergistaceae bacterium]
MNAQSFNTKPRRGLAFAPHRGLNGAGALWALALLVIGASSARAANAAQALRFDEMYGGVSSLGIVLSDRLQSLAGQTVVMEGFMAPPLKPTLSFFVLTRVPMSLCPFCS